MKILFINEILGLTNLHYMLKKENNQMHKEYLIELCNEGYMEDISEIFSEEYEKETIRHSHGILEINNNIYNFPSSDTEISKRLRIETKGHEIIDKYNSLLKSPMKIEFKEFKEQDYKSILIQERDDGSEFIDFTK